MREIKFRAWVKKEQRMIIEPGILECSIVEYDWSTVYPNYDPTKSLDSQERYTIPARTKAEYGKGLVEIMQYTGLKDKNGKEIYEGDIVKVKDCISEVEFYEGTFDLGLWPIEGQSNLCDLCEIIGNIYEQPELLE